jgi:hypothetical protein
MLTQALAVQVGLGLGKVRNCGIQSKLSILQFTTECVMPIIKGLLSAGTSLRDCARILASECLKRVIIVDTSNEIGGDGDIPHPSITTARRMQVASGCLEQALHCLCVRIVMQWERCANKHLIRSGNVCKPMFLLHRFPTLWSSTAS